MNVYDQVHKIRTTVSEKYIRNKDEYCGAASSSGRSNSLFKRLSKPSFLVESINLDIQVYDDKTIVDSTLVMKRQTAGDLVLLGRDLELQSIQLNGQDITPAQYSLDSEQLVITDAPDEVILQTQVIIHPETNTQLEGLYKADELFVTQNEPEGFRKITFYPDRPDVLSVFTTRVEADKNIQCYLPMVICLKQVR